MKRLTVIILSFLIATMTAMAGKVTESEALRKAQQFLKGKSFTSATDYRQQARGTSAPVTLFLSPFYVFNAMEGGYVIISGDDRTREVLGYSATGTLDMDNLPENLQWWLEEYARQMEAIEKGVAVAAPAHRRSPMVTIAPLVQTRWSQGKPYNLMCPDGSGRDYDEDGYDPDDRCITGCAATALAQVMNYWQWPKESPALDSYMTVDFEVKELPATTFNWGKMKNSYQSDETGEEAYAVSELMRYCGQVMYMDYGTDASGSSSSFRNALVDVFNYSQNTQRLYRDDYTTDVWEGIVYEELAERRPVLYGGASSAAGHAFVIDGYDGNGLFHFNWGWGGSYDDYYVLSIADPYHPGLDASDDGNGYSSGQEAVIGAQPFRGDETQPYAVLSNDGQTVTFYYDGLMAERHGVGIVSYRVEESPYVTASKAVIDASMANYHPYSTAFWFYECKNLKTIEGINNIKTDEVRDMSWMFHGCTSLTSLDVSKFNTDNVTSMNRTFANCSSLTSLDVSKFTTDNVTDMSWMFNGCSSLKKLDVSGFQTEKVTNMLNMFNGCSSLKSLDVSGFHTDNVTAMNAMFANCSGLTSLDVSGFQTSNVTNMNWMFGGCSGLTSLDVSGFQTSNVEDMNWMFANCSSLKKLDVSGFRTDNVTNMSVMFYNCSGLTSLDVSGFFTDNVTDMSWMFGACTSLATIYASEAWSTAQVEKSEYMFYGCQTLKGGNGTAYDDYHLDAEYACVDGGAGSPGYFTYKTYDHVDAYVALSDDGKTATFYYDKNKIQRGGKPITNSKTKTAYGTAETIAFDASFADYQPTSTAYWFLNCTALTTIRDIRNLSTDHVTNMHGMFAGCSSLKKLDVSSLKTENVTDMGNMFAGCSRLKRLNLSNFKTDNVIAMDSMFTDCSNLLTIYVNDTNWSTASVSSSYQMFHQCTRLVGGRGTTYSRYNTNAIFACVDKADTAGYLTALYSGEEPIGDAEPYAVLSSNNTVLTFYYDDKRNRRGGMDVFPFRYGSNGKTNAGWFAQAGDITTVTFDASMANCTSLTSTAFWFYMCNQLKTINGIANLRTDNVTRMDYMFYNDSQLANLDVSGFNTGNVTDMNAMFGYCSKLNSIVLGSTFVSSNANKIDYVFTGNDELKSVTFTGDIPSTINDRFFVNVGTRESPVRLIVPEQYKANYAAMFFGDLFFGGYLTLEDTSGIHAEASVNQPYDIYSLDGRLVRKGATSLKSLPKGVYIVHGRKVVVQ